MITFDQFITKWNGKTVDTDGAFGGQVDYGYQLWDNDIMKPFIIKSKTYGDLKVLLDDNDYDLITSMGKWNVSVLRGKPYAQKRIKKDQLIQMARFLMGAKSGEYVDHINHNTLDNRCSNLRVCTNAANLRNGALRVNNKSGVSGVRFDKTRNKWCAVIKVMYKSIHLGRFVNKDDAIKARKEAEVKYFNI